MGAPRPARQRIGRAPREGKAKKTGLSDQRVTKKPGEFSNLVL
jgi:hypothetical protein